jgi:hypothetical protein
MEISLLQIFFAGDDESEQEPDGMGPAPTRDNGGRATSPADIMVKQKAFWADRLEQPAPIANTRIASTPQGITDANREFWDKRLSR